MNTDKNLNGKVIIALSRALQVIHRKSEIMFRENNLTMAQFMVLEALSHKGDLTVGDLIKVVLSSSGNMTVVIRNLERDGLIFKRENPQDKRSYLISLSQQGKKLIDEIYKKHMAYVEENLKCISEIEKKNLIAILGQLK